MERTGVDDVRPARPDDFEAIVALERARFGGIGTDCYQHAHVRAWYETCPEGLVVAERDGRVVAHHYAQRRPFGFDRLGALSTHDEETDAGMTRRTHRPDGNAWYGVSLCSVARGAGRATLEWIFAQMPADGLEFFVGAARIAGFDSYVVGLENASIAWRDQTDEPGLACWYARACAAITASKIWPTMPGAPTLDLPLPSKPDPVLNKHVVIPDYGLVTLLPDYMHDPASRNYGVFVAYRAPGA